MVYYKDLFFIGNTFAEEFDNSKRLNRFTLNSSYFLDKYIFLFFLISSIHCKSSKIFFFDDSFKVFRILFSQQYLHILHVLFSLLVVSFETQMKNVTFFLLLENVKSFNFGRTKERKKCLGRDKNITMYCFHKYSGISIFLRKSDKSIENYIVIKKI